ncbi:hypothetical protein [Streptomyces diastaticus]|uniref:hypothetical protein n=1 Tax=Streptomyces diastaticus TaxID=1956 RepID=UPI00368BCE36
MPLLSDLVDNFNDNTLGPLWGDSYGGATEAGGRARVPCVAEAYAGYQTGRAWTLAGSSVYLKLVTVPAASTGTDVSANFLVTSPTVGTSIGFKVNAVTGMLRLQANIDYYDSTGEEIPYDPATHLWLRLREGDGTVSWDTSPDGTTWTTRRTLATPAWVVTDVDQCALDLYCYRDAGDPDYAEWDNVNTLSDGATVTGAATLALAAGLNAVGSRTAVGVGTLAAASTLTAAPTLTVTATVRLAAVAQLHAEPADSPDLTGVAGVAAGRHDLEIEQGATFVQTYTVLDSNWSWDGWQARAQIRTAATETADLILDLTPHLTIDGARIYLQVPAAITETLQRGGRWDLELYQGGFVVRLLEGAVRISKEVTR